MSDFFFSDYRNAYYPKLQSCNLAPTECYSRQSANAGRSHCTSLIQGLISLRLLTADVTELRHGPVEPNWAPNLSGTARKSVARVPAHKSCLTFHNAWTLQIPPHAGMRKVCQTGSCSAMCHCVVWVCARLNGQGRVTAHTSQAVGGGYGFLSCHQGTSRRAAMDIWPRTFSQRLDTVTHIQPIAPFADPKTGNAEGHSYGSEAGPFRVWPLHQQHAAVSGEKPCGSLPAAGSGLPVSTGSGQGCFCPLHGQSCPLRHLACTPFTPLLKRCEHSCRSSMSGRGTCPPRSRR